MGGTHGQPPGMYVVPSLVISLSIDAPFLSKSVNWRDGKAGGHEDKSSCTLTVSHGRRSIGTLTFE